MGNLKKLRSVELTIDSLSKKGNGLGMWKREDGSSVQVEVPFTLPGDHVRTSLRRKRGGCYSSILEEVLTPSPQRIAPRCVHFGVCGGCRLQHLSYENQLQYKENLVRQSFEKNLTPEVDFRPILASKHPWQYRNKMEYSFSSDAAGKKYLGLVMDSSRGKVFNLTECHLTKSWFVDALKATRQWWHESDLAAYYMPRDKGSLRTLTLREGQRTGDRMVILTVSGNPDFALKQHHLDGFVAFIRDAVEPISPTSNLSIVLRIQQIGKGMATNMYEMLLHGPDHIRETLHIKIHPEKPPTTLTFHISPSAFFQPNSEQAELLYTTALSMAEVPEDSVVYDLYCGIGSLGLCISKHVKQVIGIELSPESALDARTNATRNGCQNMSIITGAVRHLLSKSPDQPELPPPALIMVDPPRPGLDPQAMRHLINAGAPKILYVSCNPLTQAVNVAELVQNGYRLVAVQPVDQFPQTYHVENIAFLKRL